MAAVQNEKVSLGLVAKVELGRSVTAHEPRTEVPDHGDGLVELLNDQNLGRCEPLRSVLHAATRVELGIEAGELVARNRRKVQVVLEPAAPERVTTAVVVGKPSDLEQPPAPFRIHLGLVAANPSLHAPVVEANGVETDRLDLGSWDLEAVAVTTDAPDHQTLVVLVVRVDSMPVISQHDRTSKTRRRTEIRPRVTLVVVDRIVLHQFAGVAPVAVDVAVAPAHTDVIAAAVVATIVELAAPEVDLCRLRTLGKGVRKRFLDPGKEVLNWERRCRSSQ